MTVWFDSSSHICGCEIASYLLEKSRVVTQSAKERNYHIFDQICAAAAAAAAAAATGESGLSQNSSEFSHLGLGPPESYHYLSQSGCVIIEGTDDGREFMDVGDALNSLKFEDDARFALFSVIAGVLHLGNLQFQNKSPEVDEARLSESSSSNKALLAVSRLIQVLCYLLLACVLC